MQKDTTLKNMAIEHVDTIKYGKQKGTIVYDGTYVTGSIKVHLSFSQFSKENSPLSFRSYITYSTDEKFLSEFYIDNLFYISQITQMPISTFDLKSTRDGNRNILATPHSFYIIKYSQ